MRIVSKAAESMIRIRVSEARVVRENTVYWAEAF
jgi:hypothetical protein